MYALMKSRMDTARTKLSESEEFAPKAISTIYELCEKEKIISNSFSVD